LPLRGGHFATMETVTGALGFFKHILIGNIKKKMFGKALTKTIECALNI